MGANGAVYKFESPVDFNDSQTRLDALLHRVRLRAL